MDSRLESTLYASKSIHRVMSTGATELLGEILDNLTEEEFATFQKAHRGGAAVAMNGDASAMSQLPHYLESESDNLRTDEARDLAGLGYVLGFTLERHLDGGAL